jgi:ADP-ribosyl-[dinitrogen reductase] hydrolase
MTRPDPSDRVRGILLGLAAGDRNGGPIRMAVRLAESLADRGGLDLDDVMARYLAWWSAGAFDTGPVAAGVFALVTAGVPRRQATAAVHEETGGLTAGCNPAHRVAPLAMAAFLPDRDLPAMAALEASLTHWDPLAGDVAAATAVLLRALVRGAGWGPALGRAAAGRLAQVKAALRGGHGPLSRGGFATDVLQAAVHFVGRSRGFGPALDRSVAFAGPANYCPVLVGAIAGARWGASSMPESALRHCSILPRVCEAAEALAGGWDV